MTGMVMAFRRPAAAVRLKVAPQLASWDKPGPASQLRLAGFLDHVAEVAGPVVAAASGRVAVELTVGLPRAVPLADLLLGATSRARRTAASRQPEAGYLDRRPYIQ